MLSKLGKPFTAVGRYMSQTIAEIRKTVTPTGGELAGWAFGCFLFVSLLMVSVTGMDFGLGKLMLMIFG